MTFFTFQGKLCEQSNQRINQMYTTVSDDLSVINAPYENSAVFSYCISASFNETCRCIRGMVGLIIG